MKVRGNQSDGGEDMYSSTHWHAPTHEKTHAYHKKNTIWKKLAVSVAAVATAIGGVTVTTSAAQAATNRDSYADTVENSTFQAARAKYGLTEQMSEGATLHAWEWSFKTIEQHIPEIAAAGYTSVQTEPISAIHTGNKGKIFTENWYYVYQPTDTTIGNWVMGSESDLKSLCATAHKYGVRIIVDVVANHMTATWNAIADRWRKSDLYHHDCNDGEVQDYNNRYQVTHCKLLGLYDINTSKTETANMMHDYLVQAVNDGVDGFRFDAAKHIELPNEYDGSQYWNIVLNNGTQFQYGEVLQDSISHDADYAKLFANNSRHGGGVTASYYGVKLRGALSSKNLNAGNLNNWDNAAGGNNLVSWVESHDNYSNKPDDYGASLKMSEWEMTMGWGVIGSRSQTMPLYFDRPVGSGGSQPQFAEKNQLGDAGSDSWKDPQVVAVNHFRNKMNNAKAKEYMRNCGDNSCLMVERYIKDGNADSDGVTVVNMNGDKSLAGTETTLDDGTYTDQVNGGTLTVSGGKITSGTAKGGKISVFYNNNLASVSANPTGGSFKTDTTKVTLHASNVTSASYTTSEGASGSYQDGDTITIGAKTAVNGTITLKLQGTDKDGKTVSAEYTFTKKDPAAVSVAYAKKPSNWSNLYAYVYVDDSSAATLKQNAKWPGVAMTKVSAGDSCGKDGEYKYEIPDGFDENVRIIFNDGNATNTLKYPADTTEGVDAAGLKIDGTYAWNGDTTASGTWTARSCAVVTVNSVKINQKDFTTDLTNGVKTIKLTATTDPAGVNVSWSSSNEAVAKVASDGTVTPVKAGTAKITAKSGGKTASITVTVTGVPPLDPVEKNTIYATKPSGWGDLYAYVYTGDGATAVNNAAWPGVKMTATTASDGCRQANAYKYVVPDDLAKGAKVIFNDGGSKQFPGSRQPGIAYDGGIVKWDGARSTLRPLNCTTTVPVTSVAHLRRRREGRQGHREEGRVAAADGYGQPGQRHRQDGRLDQLQHRGRHGRQVRQGDGREGRHRDRHREGGRQDRERRGHRDRYAVPGPADDGVLQGPVLVEEREGELQGVLEPAAGRGRGQDDPGVRRLVEAHDPRHEGREGQGRVHGRQLVGQQRRQGLLRHRRGDGRVRRQGLLLRAVVPARQEAADDGVVQAGLLVEDGEGELQGVRRQADRRHERGPDGVVRRLVEAHDPRHEGRAGQGRVHGRQVVGQQLRQELLRDRVEHGRGRRAVHRRRDPCLRGRRAVAEHR